MNKKITTRHYCGIEYHGLTAQEVGTILDITKGSVLDKYVLHVASEWDRNETTGTRTRKETYFIRINSHSGSTMTTDVEEFEAWQKKQTAELEKINELIEEHF